jgi:hypothetical protein
MVLSCSRHSAPRPLTGSNSPRRVRSLQCRLRKAARLTVPDRFDGGPRVAALVLSCLLIAATVGALYVRASNGSPAPSSQTLAEPDRTVATAAWQVNHPNPIWNMDSDLRVTEVGTATMWAQAFTLTDAAVYGYIGLQQDGNRFDGSRGPLAIFSVWGASAMRGTSCRALDEGGPVRSCRIVYPFKRDHWYRLRLWYTGREGEGEWLSAFVVDLGKAGDDGLLVGSLLVPAGSRIAAARSPTNSTSGPPPTAGRCRR